MAQVERKAEKRRGNYPLMQNPGDTRLPEGVVLQPPQHVLLINGATLANPTSFDKKVMLYKNGSQPPTSEQEKNALAETTLPFFERRNGH